MDRIKNRRKNGSNNNKWDAFQGWENGVRLY